MKLTPFALLLLCFSCQTDPQKRPSPLMVENDTIRGVAVELTYSSPSVRDRQIFGKGSDYLEQYDEVWRTGANKASTLYFSSEVLLDSTLLDSGKYSIYTIPHEDSWTVIINEEWDQWGSYNYEEALDVMRVEVPVNPLAEKQERMRLFIEDHSLKFQWEYTSWFIPITLP